MRGWSLTIGVVGYILGLMLTGCAEHMQTVTIVFGSRPDPLGYYCSYEAFKDGSSYGIIKMQNGPVPTEGANITGNLSGFGDRALHNVSSGDNIEAEVTYHANSYDAVINELREVGCTV